MPHHPIGSSIPVTVRPHVVHVYSRRVETLDVGHAPTTYSSKGPANILTSSSDLDISIIVRKGKRTYTYPISSFVSL